MFDIFKRVQKLENIVGEEKPKKEERNLLSNMSYYDMVMRSFYYGGPVTLIEKVDSQKEQIEKLEKKLSLLEKYLNIEVTTTEKVESYGKRKKVKKSRDCDED